MTLRRDRQEVLTVEMARAKANLAEEARSQDSATGSESRGRYLYGVANAAAVTQLGPIGIDASPVYTVPYGTLCAIVHNCADSPYQSADEQIVKNWVKTHQTVLERAMELFGSVIPMSFDTILQAKSEPAADQVVRDWLRENDDKLKTILKRVEGKDEYGIQLYYELSLVSRRVIEHSPQIRQMKEEIATKSPGTAYLYRQKLEKALRNEVEELADQWFQDFYRRITKYVDDIVVDKTRSATGDKKMLLNLSCLVARENVASLGEELEQIARTNGFSVHFSGPWPPYSFVAKPVTSLEKEAENGTE